MTDHDPVVFSKKFSQIPRNYDTEADKEYNINPSLILLLAFRHQNNFIYMLYVIKYMGTGKTF